MLVGFFLSRSISNLVGYAYPAYASFKAIRDGKKEKYSEWLMYWYENRFDSHVPDSLSLSSSHATIRPHAPSTNVVLRAVISCFTAFESFGDVLVSWLPFYYEAKVAFIVYLVYQRKAAVMFYRKFLHPTLETYEDHIDKSIDDATREAQRGAAHVGKLGIKALHRHSSTLLHMGQKALVQTATLAAQAEEEERREAAENKPLLANKE